MEKKTSRLRFTYEDDVILLREFVSVNPIKDLQGWEVIQAHIRISTGKNFLIRTLKQHLMLLLELFLKNVKSDEVR